MASIDPGEQLRSKITVAHVEAEKLKDRLRDERDRLADTTRELPSLFRSIGGALLCCVSF